MTKTRHLWMIWMVLACMLAGAQTPAPAAEEATPGLHVYPPRVNLATVDQQNIRRYNRDAKLLLQLR